jgi:type II secretory pathway predicted ATPase ExeA
MQHDHAKFGDGSKELRQRIAALRSKKFMRYSAAGEILDSFEELFYLPDGVHQNYILTASTGNGKTTLARHFLKSNPLDLQAEADAASLPIAYMCMPEKAKVGSFANRLLESLMQSCSANMPHDERLHIARTLLKSLGTKILIIDEFQHLNTGSVTERAALRNVVKEIGEYCNLSVIGVGTPVSLGIIASEPQLARRFEPRALPLWKCDDEGRSLLCALESQLPLEKTSDLGGNARLASEIIDLAEGIFDYINKLIDKAAISAIRTGKEKIDMTLLKSLNWIKPSNRPKAAANAMGYSAREVGI